jgi:hypothetical protein
MQPGALVIFQPSSGKAAKTSGLKMPNQNG